MDSGQRFVRIAFQTGGDHGFDQRAERVAKVRNVSSVGTHLLRFRRDPEMERGAGRRMVDAAQDLLGLNYSKYGFAKATLDQFMKMGYRSRRDKPQLICSTLYVDAYSRQTAIHPGLAISNSSTPEPHSTAERCGRIVEAGSLRKLYNNGHGGKHDARDRG